MQRSVCFVVLGSMLALVLVIGAMAQPPEKGARRVFVEEVRNDHAGFSVRVDVDRLDRIYRCGEVMRVKVKSSKPGYLILFYESADGKISCLFPNRIQCDNWIPADKEIEIPAPDALFRLRVGPPYGKEVLKAIVTLTPLHPRKLGVKSLTDADATRLDAQGLKGVYVELKEQPACWAEHHVNVTTIPADKVRAVRGPRRVGLYVGVSDFADTRIRRLSISHNDAGKLREAMKEHCDLDKVILLIDEQATLANIRTAICDTLAEATQPGDVVFIYWSGHGARCADDNNDERDGYDEYLVPYDGRLDDLEAIRRSMLLDDTFGRWIQDLDGRRIVVILDTCHSGGHSKYEKGLGLPEPVAKGEFDFLDGEFARIKDIGHETAMLASAKASQVAFERREGDLSTMTYFLIKLLEQGNGPITLTQAFEHLKIQVPAYVEKQFPGTTQTPVLVKAPNTKVYLRL